MSTTRSYIIDRDKEFLKFLKGRYPFFHLSNVFFRDLHYGVMAYLEQNKIKHTYPSAEDVTREVVNHFEGQKVFHRIDERTWLLHYPAFKAVSTKKPAARPAPARPAAPRPAGATPAAKPAPVSAPPASAPAPATSADSAAKKTEVAAPATSAEAKAAPGTLPAAS